MNKYILVGLMVLSCFDIKAQTRTGDNLGTHKAEKDLNMNDKKIVSVSGMVIGNATMINNTSVALELSGTDKAFLFNRVSSLSAIVAPVDGMAVYNNTDQRFYIRQNGVWETLAAIGDLFWSKIVGKPTFAAVALSGDYNDLLNKPSIPTLVSQLTNDAGYITTTSLMWSNITGKPSFHVVATSGDYNDLLNKPNIPTALSQLTNDPGFITNTALTWSNITGKPSFHAVATSGNYNDLSNRPSIPTALSQLTNDPGYITGASLTWSNITGKPSFHAVATSGNYNDLSNRPSIPTALSQLTNDPGYITGASLTWSNITGKPSFHAVATSGNYNDLSNRPSIPTALSQLTNDLGNYGGWITTNGRAYPRRADGTDMNFNWSGQSGQPTWLWGSNDGINHYVWNPSNFSVNYANSANTANSATTATNAGALGGYTPSDYLGKEGNTYYQQRTWIAVNGDYGTYYPGATGFAATPYFYPTGSTYGVFRIDGYRNGYTGFYMGYAGVNSAMYDGSGNGGEYNASYGWYTYFSRGNTCMGINGSTTSSTYAMYLNGKGIYASGSSAVAGQLDVSGDVVGFSSLPSDTRLKKNMKRITGASDIVRKLGGYYFDWKKNGKHDIGVKAQEVEQVIPEIVSETKLPFQSPLGESDSTKYKIVQYEKLVAVLIEAQKEQMELVDQLRIKNEENRKVIESLLKRVSDLEKKIKLQQGGKSIPLSKK